MYFNTVKLQVTNDTELWSELSSFPSWHNSILSTLKPYRFHIFTLSRTYLQISRSHIHSYLYFGVFNITFLDHFPVSPKCSPCHTHFFLMFCLPCILIIFVMKTNLMHYLSLIYFITQPLHVYGIFIAHHEEVFTVYVQQLVCVMCSGWFADGRASCQSTWTRHIQIAVHIQ
jgi:hypothetical protein